MQLLMSRKPAVNNNYNKYKKHNVQERQGLFACSFITIGTGFLQQVLGGQR